jgi:hypothetical protein
MKTEVKERGEQNGKMTALRFDPKIRYLADLASTVRKESLTKYIENALLKSFKDVSLHVAEDPEPFLDSKGNWQMPEPPNADEELRQNAAKSIDNLADLLWSDSEYVRMLMLSRLGSKWQPEEDKALLDYIEGRKDLWIKSEGGAKPNREKINAEWDSIKAAFAKTSKAKGGKK